MDRSNEETEYEPRNPVEGGPKAPVFSQRGRGNGRGGGRGKKFPPRKGFTRSTPSASASNPRQDQPQKRQAPHGGLPEYGKESKPSISQMQPRVSKFGIYCGTSGLPRLCRAVRNTITSKDSQLNRLLSYELLLYVSTCSVNYRLAKVSTVHGKVTADDLSKVGKLLEGMKLPVAICNYIETFGVVKMANGAQVYPGFAKNVNQLLDIAGLFELMPRPVRIRYIRGNPGSYFFDHRTLRDELRADLGLADAIGVPVFDPASIFNGDLPATAWEIDPEIIAHYRQNLRIDKAALAFREVDYDNLDGKEEMLVSIETSEGSVKPLSPQAMVTASATLGAMFQFRGSDSRTWYPFPDNYLVDGRTFIGSELGDIEVELVAYTGMTNRV